MNKKILAKVCLSIVCIILFTNIKTYAKTDVEVKYISGIWRAVVNGVVDYKYNGIGKNENGTWYVKNGTIKFDYTGTIWDGEIGYIIEGNKVYEKIKKDTTKVMYINETWRMVKNGVVDYNYNGIGKNENGTWVLQNGKVDFKYYGIYKDVAGDSYIVEGSKILTEETSVKYIENNWRYVKNGKIIYDFEGIASNENGTWYVKNGTIKFDYIGTIWDGEIGYIIEGNKVYEKIKKDTTKVMYINETWRMLKNGVVDYNYNGIGENENGIWLLENGKVTFKFNGNYTDIDNNIFGVKNSRINEIIKNINHLGNMAVEEPYENKECKKSIEVSGWAVSKDNNDKIYVYIDEKWLGTANRTYRNDVIDEKYGGIKSTPNSGFYYYIDLSNISEGVHILKVVNYTEDEKDIIQSRELEIRVNKTAYHEEGIYGKTAYGQDMKYYKVGTGPNVFFATFSIHGYEDLWNRDGEELIYIANEFYNKLISQLEIEEKWTIYIFPGVNMDGINYGYTNNGPGRTTLYSDAPKHKGIDLNRCWQIGDSYTKYTDSRNYNGTSGFQSVEARNLRDFFLSHKAKNGKNVLVDLHGWTQQLIGDERICEYYKKYFPENNPSAVGRYGTGYMINWARTYLGNSNYSARTALIELPNYGNSVRSHQDVINNNFVNRYIQSTLDMLKNL